MKKLKLLLILSFISLLAIPTALASTAPVVYVATDGSGDYNCDGTNDQVQINQAMDFVASHSGYTTVHLKSGTYIIGDTIFIHSNTILEGEPGAIVKLKDESGWVRHKGLIEPSSKGAHNFVIRDFEVNGNLDKQTYIVTQMGEPCKHGRGYQDLFRADRDSVSGDHSGPYDFEIYNMYFHDGANDGIRVRGDGSEAGIKIYDNTFYRTGHDDIFIMSADNVFIDNNAFTWIYGDCGIRIENSDDVTITNNVMDSINPPKNPQGLSGIYLSSTSSSTMTNYNIAYNEIHDTREMGILMCNRVGGTYSLDKVGDAHIHHNLLYNCGTNAIGSYSGGIWVHGWNNVLIENNVIDGSQGDGIAHRARFSGSTQSGYVTTVRNNIITNTVERSSLSSSGYGVNSYLSTHSFVLENNDVWNNDNGNYRNVGSHASDRNVDPLFVDRANHDYHLRSNSPLIGTGMGVYDGSGSTPLPPTQPSNSAPVLSTIGSKAVNEGSSLSFVVRGTDVDGDSLTYSATGLPVGANFNAASREFMWTPDSTQTGTYSVTFRVTDGKLADSETVSIAVVSAGSPATTPESMYVNRLRESSPDSTFAGDSYVDVGNLAGVGSYREVMWFDLSEYNETDTVTSATLSLSWYYPENAPRNQDTIVEVYRASDWDPAQVSWNEKASGTSWNNAGGDWFDSNGVAQGSVPYASITFSGSDVPDNGNYEFDVTELVREYVSGEHANTGFFIKARNENDNYIAFDGIGSVNADKQPKLAVTLSTNGGSTGDGGVSVDPHKRWDVNRDGTVNILDLTIVAQNLGTTKPHPSWDVNEDGEVNIQDLTIVAYHFGEKTL
ncbi:disaggregatase related repeat-containing protein [Methanococcoides methylutens]|uniref:disaggregatase related repeat-containing protein n=1 Tax=Methanococcoides methylutens TaxID=2226 RepID=UPI004043B288